jgi:hypothetical protein
MLQKFLSLGLGVIVIGHLFFRPQLKQLGRRIDRLVTLMAVAVFVTWACQLVYLLATRR